MGAAVKRPRIAAAIPKPAPPGSRAKMLRGASPMALQAQIAANVNQRIAREKPKEK